MGTFQRGRFSPVASELPVDGWFVVRNGFKFGYPWPWQDAETVDIVDSSGIATSEDVIGTLQAPRATGVARLVVWAGRGGFDTMWQNADQGLAKVYGRAPRELRHIRLGTGRAVAGDIDAGGQRFSRLIAESPRGHLIHAELSVPLSSGPGYRPHFDTMLASWQWL